MGFDSGSMSFQRFAVIGAPPLQAEILDRLKANALKPSDLGLPLDAEWGWSGPRHGLDAEFDFGTCVFNDCIFFGLRIDTNTPPGSVKRAYQLVEEETLAKQNPSGFISKQQKLAARDAVSRRIDEEKRAGKYHRSKMIPLLWDLTTGVLYGPASLNAVDKLRELFPRTFDGFDLQPLSAGHLALRLAETMGARRAYEDATPTRFSLSPEDPDAPAEYPWTAKGDGAKDYLGNEFLLWLWHRQHLGTGRIGHSTAVVFDRTLQLDCVFNHTGKETLTATGPTQLPEAIAAIRTGKVPRKAGLIIDFKGDGFNLTLTGESLAVTTLRLPDVEEADTPRTLFEERITLLRAFDTAIGSMFREFIIERFNGWAAAVEQIQAWIASFKRAA